MDKTYKVALNTRIDPDLKEKLKELVANKQPSVTVSAYVEWLIQQEVEKHSAEQAESTEKPTDQ